MSGLQRRREGATSHRPSESSETPGIDAQATVGNGGLQDAARDMCVVGAHIFTLRIVICEQGSGGQKEFAHEDVLRQPSLSTGVRVFQLDIAAKQPIEDRLQEPALEAGRGARHFERKTGEDG